MIKPAKVIKAPAATESVPVAPTAVTAARANVLRRVLVEASERAEQVLSEAEQRARQLVSDAERSAGDVRRVAVEEGRAQGYAEALARLNIVARLEAEADQRGLDRSVEMARILAERLIGAAVRVDDSAVVGLATRVLTEVRGAHRIELRVHPADVAALERASLPASGLEIVADDSCGRGDFRAVTDVGTIDAKLGERLDLLAVKLAEALRKST